MPDEDEIAANYLHSRAEDPVAHLTLSPTATPGSVAEMTRFELIFHAAKDGFTPAGFDAFTDRLADAFPSLEAKHPWLVDLDLAADLAAGVVTVGASVAEPDEHPVVEVLGGTVVGLRGDVEFAYYQIQYVVDSAPPILPWVECMSPGAPTAWEAGTARDDDGSDVTEAMWPLQLEAIATREGEDA